MRRRRRRLQLRRKDPERGGRCRHREGSGCGRNKLWRRTGVRSKVRLRKECEGVTVPGTAADSRSGAPGESPGGLGAARRPKGDFAGQSRGRPGEQGGGGGRGSAGTCWRGEPQRAPAELSGAGPSRSAVGWFQLPASRPPAPPAAARPPLGPRSPPLSTGTGMRPAAAGAGCESRCGTWRGDPAAGDNSGGSWAHAARRAGCARRAHVPARNAGVCVCAGDVDIYIYGA